MSTPYRSAVGTPCPRCKDPLRPESDAELVCANGCGTWLGNRLIKPILDPDSLVRSKGNPFKATPLPPTRCLVCKAPLNDLYQGDPDVLSFGQCLEHGIWLEREGRERFEARFAPEVARTQIERARRAELARISEQADPVVARLSERVEALEAEVRTLRRELDELRRRV